MAGLMDPTVAGKYPVILGEGLLGKTSNDIFTGIRYNHRPALSSGDAPASARLRPSIPGKASSYDLSFNDGDDKYAYAGTRNVDGNQYVLHFDPDRKAYILDKIDSTFNMNLTRMPGNSDAAKLSRQFPHLDNQPQPARKADDAKATKPPLKENAKGAVQPKPRRKAEKKPQPQNDIELSLPKPEPAKEKAAPPKRLEHGEEDDDDDDDGGLLIEYPGAETTAKHNDFSPAFPPLQRFDDFMDQRDSEGDADGESDDEPDMDFKLPSPVKNHAPRLDAMDEDQDDDDDEQHQQQQLAEDPASADMEIDLEKEMEMAFGDLENGQEGTPDGDESEISEED